MIRLQTMPKRAKIRRRSGIIKSSCNILCSRSLIQISWSTIYIKYHFIRSRGSSSSVESRRLYLCLFQCHIGLLWKLIHLAKVIILLGAVLTNTIYGNLLSQKKIMQTSWKNVESRAAKLIQKTDLRMASSLVDTLPLLSRCLL